MPRAAGLAACLLATTPPGAAAIDLGAQTGLGLRAACVAYVLTDLAGEAGAGRLSPADQRAESTALAVMLRGQAGRPNAALERRIDEMIERLDVEAPAPAEVAAKAQACRGLLGL